MMKWLTETFIGIAAMAMYYLLYVLFIGFQKLCEEDTKKGKIARFIGKIGSDTLLTYIAICSIVGLIIGLLAIFT